FGLLPASRPHTGQMPLAPESRALEPEHEVALGEPLVRISLRNPAALIPYDHRAASIFALRDITFEMEILDRMVLGSHRKPFFAERQARPPRYGPPLQDPVDLHSPLLVHPPPPIPLDPH